MNKPITPLASMEARLKATGCTAWLPRTWCTWSYAPIRAPCPSYLRVCWSWSGRIFIHSTGLGARGGGVAVWAGSGRPDCRRAPAAGTGLCLFPHRGRAEAFAALLAAMGCTGNAVLDGERWCVYLETLRLRAGRGAAAAKADGSRASNAEWS
ncbi:MAG: hypothetical protein ACLSB9_08620 [Hydrogeniiclostridium mannosilyticum]